MVINSFRAFLFTAAGATAAVATAYVSGALDPYLTAGRAAVESPSEPASPKSERVGQQQAAVEPGKATQPAAPAEPKPAAKAEVPEVVAPSFDIVRVEPDGSIVVAGKAAPEAMVEIVAGSTVLGKTQAGADGDFAIALDDRLQPGGHELVLRSTAKDNVVATSPETAVVSIPEEKDGQVLALVEKPGEPSKLITVPRPEPAGQKATSQAEKVPLALDGKPAPSSETAEAMQPEAPAKPEAANAEPPAGGQSAPAAEQPEAAAGPKIAVDAVEIEGRKVFVAGAADPGRKVRVYANDILLGEAPASPGGRFLIETERELPVGDYIIRADVLEPDSDKVVARAAVPFEREPGNAVAAVAPEASKPANAGAQVQPSAPAGSAPSADNSAKPSEPNATAPSTATVPPATAEMPPSTTEAGQGETSMPAGETAPAPAGKVAAVAPDSAAAKLESVNGAVIIRRGDTLWKISRRVYGRGVRYSTIYLANQDQISDPDRIWPGQVFNVPGQTTEGEPADMSAVKDQATKPPSKASQ
jgi:nucleoid-associated protein YgaU